MKVHKVWIGSKKPATKGDLADLQEDIHVDLQEMNETMKTVLSVVKDIDRHNKENRDIPDRVTKLENDVFKFKLRR